MLDADLNDIPNASYTTEMPSPLSISEEENLRVIKNMHTFKAAGSDDFPFYVIKCLEAPLFLFFNHSSMPQ